MVASIFSHVFMSSGGSSTEDDLIEALSGSTDSAMWDFTQASDSGTLTVADLTGNGNTISQATADNKPAIVATGLSFDDTDDTIGFTAASTISNATIFVEFAHNGSSTVGQIVTATGGGAGGMRYQAGNANAQLGTLTFDDQAMATRGDLYTAVNADTDFHTLELRHNFSWAGLFFGRTATAPGGIIRRAVLIIDADMGDLSNARSLASQWVQQT